jgi:hypothetical protein
MVDGVVGGAATRYGGSGLVSVPVDGRLPAAEALATVARRLDAAGITSPS